jgi:hypothetical protein
MRPVINGRKSSRSDVVDEFSKKLVKDVRCFPERRLLTVANLPDWATNGIRVGLAEADAAECMRLQSSWVRLRFHLAATSGAE